MTSIFWADVVRVQAHEPCEALAAFLLFTWGSSSYCFDQAVISLVGRVVLEDIQDEAFLDCLAHAVKVECFGLSIRPRLTEYFDRLVLRSCRKGEEADIRLSPPLRHGLEDFFFASGRPSSSAFALAFSLIAAPARVPFSSIALSPPWELCASSIMTAYLRFGSSPIFFGHVRELLEGCDDDRSPGSKRSSELG